MRTENGALERGRRPEWFSDVEEHPENPRTIKRKTITENLPERRDDAFKTTD
jgi:hypothetical protein